MVKDIRLIPLVLFLIVASCKKDIRLTFCEQNPIVGYLDHGVRSICSTNLCTEYLGIWKDLIKEKNNLSQDFLDTNIKLHRSSINTWSRGTSFRVCYEIQIGWAIAYNCDQFIININNDNTHYPALDLPRGKNLNKAEIKLAVENKAFASRLAKINNATELAYEDKESALDELIKYAGVNDLCFNRIMLDKNTGNLVLEANAEYAGANNACIFGSVDLITRTTETMDNPCVIH